MPSVLHELRETAAVRWRRDLAGPETSVRKHWSTKTNYYRAVDALLAEGHAGPLSWTDIVATVQPHGSRTTFFDVAGPHAKRPLHREYDGTPLGACLARETVPEMLIDETKVWSYWPHRVGWMHELFRAEDLTRPAVAETLIRVLLDWATREPGLAAMIDHAPPACAVEDLMVIREGRLSATAAYATLQDAIRLRLAPGGSTDGVLHRLRRTYRPEPDPAPANRRLAQAIDQLTRNSHASHEQRRHAVALMRDAITILDRPAGRG